MSIHPEILSSLLADLVRVGEKSALSTRGLDGFALVGRLPTAVALPTQATHTALKLPPLGLLRVGLDLDMACWPLRLGGPSGWPALTLGRDPRCDLVIPHPSISHRHATFRGDARGATVEDLGSTAGTVVGERRLEKGVPVPLADGDWITLGEQVMAVMSARRLVAALMGS